jgi:hypothetical protein
MKSKLEKSWELVKFYETTRIWFKNHQKQLKKDYKEEMITRAPEHRMDFEEYCLVVLYLIFKENPKKRKEDGLFKTECEDLILYYQNNHEVLKTSWDKKSDKILFEWVLTSYDRHKADSRGTLSLSTLNIN